MRCTPRLLLSRNRYTRPVVILPQPYKLFHESLLTYSEVGEISKWPESLLFGGLELFRKVTGLGTDAYVHSLWDKLSDKQREIFVHPPAKVYENWVRITEGYKEAEKILVENASENPFFNTRLYPWEIIKDKLRNKPVFAADVYDQLIHEVMNPPKKLYKPELLYENFCMYFQNLDEQVLPYEDLPDEKKLQYMTIAKRKKEFLLRKADFRRARKSLLKGISVFENEYSREIGDSMPEPEKAEFIKLQWEHEKLTTLAQTRQITIREISFETQVAMIMDYIFEYNSVETCNVDWRAWRKRVSGDYHYLDHLLFPYLVGIRADSIEFHAALPKHLPWLSKNKKNENSPF